MTTDDLLDAWRPDPDDEETADDRLLCERCGTPLGDDPDDDPTGGPGGSALCGECERTRDFEADLGALDAQDGELDGVIDW
jgi:hypothetical protein